jgi:hemoglobin/transferrin/lactoferrin receptor protein
LSGTPIQIGQTRSFFIETTGFDVNNTSRFDMGEAKLAVTYGADLFHDDVKVEDAFGTADLFTPTGERTVYGGFVQGHLSWSIVDVIAAARYDAFDLSGGSASSSGNRLSPKVTLGVTPFTGFQVYGTYAEGYRSPAITETLIGGFHPPPFIFEFLPNPGLKPEVGRTLEAGVNVKYDNVLAQGDTFRAKAAVFQNDVTDFIEGDFNPVALTFQYVNVSDARLQGVEGEAVYDAGTWFASVAGSLVRGDNETTGEPLQSVYPDKLILGAGVRVFEEQLTLSGWVTLVAEQDRLPAAAAGLESESYELVDLYATYAHSDSLLVFASAENIFDVSYRRYRDGDESPGFVAKVGLTARIGQ